MVIVVCACAAIGAAIAPAIAAMANILFRMVNSFARSSAGLRQRAMRANSSRAALFRKTRGLIRGISGNYCEALEPVEAVSVLLFAEPRQRLSCRPRFDFPHPISRRLSMTITAAHISADRRPDRGYLDPDHAAAAQFHRRHLPDLRRSGRPRRAQDVASSSAGKRASRLARNPSKWCKARIFSSFSDSCNAMAKAVAKSKKTAAKSAAKSKPSARAKAAAAGLAPARR